MSDQPNTCGCDTSDLEHMPMNRYANPIPTCDCGEERHSSCSCARELEQILAALACQNQLLVDLLGAVNGLAATLLSGRMT